MLGALVTSSYLNVRRLSVWATAAYLFIRVNMTTTMICMTFWILYGIVWRNKKRERTRVLLALLSFEAAFVTTAYCSTYLHVMCTEVVLFFFISLSRSLTFALFFILSLFTAAALFFPLRESTDIHAPSHEQNRLEMSAASFGNASQTALTLVRCSRSYVLNYLFF